MRRTFEIAFPIFVFVIVLIWINYKIKTDVVTIAMDDTALFRCVDATESLLAKTGGEVVVDYFVTLDQPTEGE